MVDEEEFLQPVVFVSCRCGADVKARYTNRFAPLVELHLHLRFSLLRQDPQNS